MSIYLIIYERKEEKLIIFCLSNSTINFKIHSNSTINFKIFFFKFAVQLPIFLIELKIWYQNINNLKYLFFKKKQTHDTILSEVKKIILQLFWILWIVLLLQLRLLLQLLQLRIGVPIHMHVLRVIQIWHSI